MSAFRVICRWLSRAVSVTTYGLAISASAAAPPAPTAQQLRFFETSVRPILVEHCQDSFTLISAIDSYIHVEVKKLYPDADLPSFQTEQTEPNQLWVRYRSVRGFADLAEGLFEGCFDHYGEDVDMLVEDCSGGAKTDVKFRFQRKGPARG